MYLRELYNRRIIYIKITKVSDVKPKTCPYKISTKYPEKNARNNLLLVGSAIAHYMLISNIHSGAIYPSGSNMSVKIIPTNILNKIIII